MNLDEQVAEFERAHVQYYSTDGAMVDVGTLRALIRRALQPEVGESTEGKALRAMVFKAQWKAADPEALEPWYTHWVGELTAQGLHSKADIATVLAILSHRLAKDI